jgi:transcription antitermination factor NusG
MFGSLKPNSNQRICNVPDAKNELLTMLTHISYSSILLFLNNPSAWHTKYILGIKDQETNPAALTGLAFHKYMEFRLTGKNHIDADRAAHGVISSAHNVKWGKTGSPDKCDKELDQLTDHIQNNLNTYLAYKILGVEMRIEGKVRGIQLPIKSFIDFVYENNNQIEIIDWKTVKNLEENLSPSYIFQACVYYWQVEKEIGRKPYCMKFVQIKASKNKDDSPQIKELVFVYGEHLDYLNALKHLVRYSINQMTRKTIKFLPNLRDDYDGEKELKRYIAQFSK